MAANAQARKIHEDKLSALRKLELEPAKSRPNVMTDENRDEGVVSETFGLVRTKRSCHCDRVALRLDGAQAEDQSNEGLPPRFLKGAWL